MINEQLLREAEANGTFDLEALEKTLNEIRITSYNFLRQVQREMVGHKRFDVKAADLKRISTIDKKFRKYPTKYVAFLDGNFISEKKRLVYMKSEFYNKELDIFTVSAHPEIFVQNYMVFVDGKLLDTVNLYCAEDKTYLIFDVATQANPTGLPLEYFNDIVARNVDITAYFIPNCAYGVYNTNRFVLEKYKDNLSLDRFDIRNNLDTETKYITFINSNDLLFSSVITDTTNSTDMLRFADNTVRNFQNKYVHLNIFGFRNLLDKIDVPNTIHSIEKKADLGNLSAGSGKSVVYSPDDTYKVVVSSISPFVTMYKKINGVYEALPQPIDLPPNEPNDCAFSPDGKYVTVVHGTGTPLTIYKREGDTFTKLPTPAVVPTGTGRGVAFSHDSKYMVISHVSDPYITIYRIDSNDVFTKLDNPAVLPSSTGYSVAFSPNDKYLAVANAGAPAVTIYKKNGDVFTKLPGPDVAPLNNCKGVSFSPDGRFLAVTHIDSPLINIYEIGIDTFTKLPDPNVLPTGEPNKCEF